MIVVFIARKKCALKSTNENGGVWVGYVFPNCTMTINLFSYYNVTINISNTLYHFCRIIISPPPKKMYWISAFLS